MINILTVSWSSASTSPMMGLRSIPQYPGKEMFPKITQWITNDRQFGRNLALGRQEASSRLARSIQ